MNTGILIPITGMGVRAAPCLVAASSDDGDADRRSYHLALKLLVMLAAMFLVVWLSALVGLLVGLLVYPLALIALGTGSAGADFTSAAAQGLTAQGDWPKIKLAQEVSRV